MTDDALASVRWECTSTAPNVAPDPTALEHEARTWMPAEVPGTVAAARRAHGDWSEGASDADQLDGRDWWFRCRFGDSGDGARLLRFGGLATIADVWLNGTHLLHSDNMFVEHVVEIDQLEPVNDLYIRFGSLTAALEPRRPRPRWKTRLFRHQNLRWIRTTLLGRMDGWAAWAAPVGPWRPVELIARERLHLRSHAVDVRCAGAGGSVAVRATLAVTGDRPVGVRLRVGDTTAPMELSGNGAELAVEGVVHLESVERWWPHTHGAQPRYPVALEFGDETVDLATVGFRTVALDRADDGFTLRVNDAAIFCRGAVWIPPDVVSMTATSDQLRTDLEMLRDAGMNMVRVAGFGTYESPAFWELCDDLGIMVWQDCMIASCDPPDDADFVAALERELTQVFTKLQGRPALALVCGSNETYQQGAMYGLELGSWENGVLEKAIPLVVEQTLPEVPYIASSPIGGQLPFDPAVGVAHYFGVGAYLRPLSDARLAGVRFASECLAFSVPPERASVDEMFGGSAAAGHAAAWKAGVARDAGASWDFEDVRDFYVRELFGREALETRHADPDRALDLGRAAVAEVMAHVMSEWRRPGSRCAGGIVLSWRDLWAGAGWGLVDSRGRPKAPLFALRRTLDPVALLIADEGLSGLQLHVVNDRPRHFKGRLALAVYGEDGVRVEYADEPVDVPPGSACTMSAAELLGGFRDLTRAYRFGPAEHDVVRATLRSDDDGTERETFYLPLGAARPRLADVGLTALARQTAPRTWSLTITTEQFAQWVAVDAPGYEPSDSWFHLAPRSQRTIHLRAESRDQPPRGEIRALNSRATATIRVADHS